MAGLKVALLQIADQGSTEANLERGLEACTAAAGRGADIAVLPEIWSHGYRFFAAGSADGEAAWRASALAEASAFVGEHRRVAKKLGLAIGLDHLEAGRHGTAQQPGADRSPG